MTDPARAAYEYEIDVRPEDIDELGHVNNTVYLRWVQDAAVAHWRYAATPEQQADLFWMVIRHEIDYKRPAMPDDRIVARTWVGGSVRLKFDRHTEILRASDRKLLAQVRTVWVPIDPVTLRPKQVSDEIRARFSVDVV